MANPPLDDSRGLTPQAPNHAARPAAQGSESPRGHSRLTFRRLVGLDRSGGPPPETRRGEALHPWTIPNAIGFARIALIPVFLVVALESDDGRDGTAFALFAVIGIAGAVVAHHSLLIPPAGRILAYADTGVSRSARTSIQTGTTE